ncbi:MAG: aldehyde dehydrogenase family protein, partial [Chitinivibrionales bacterium]|nr:aldehyde dehydrogenase family protein [Chitinivibrionales bacterium]
MDPLTDIRIQGSEGVDEWLAPIAGEWRRSETLETFDVTNPATGHRVHRVQKCTPADVLDAIDGAHRWVSEGGLAPADRLEVMDRAAHLVRQHAGELAMTITVESGKPISSARKEVDATAERLDLSREDTLALRGEYIPGEWTQDTTGKYAVVTRRPLGVVAALAPFNYPLFIGAAKIIPALLAGNGVVVKPPSDAPLGLLLFAKILQE